MKKTITASERLQLLGLLTLAIEHQKIVSKAEDEMHRITECKDGYSHLTDAIYEGDIDIDTHLSRMEIDVKDEA